MKFIDPHATLLQLGLKDGMKVLDAGCGSGHYALAAAKMIDGGRVYAIDIQEDVLTRLKDDASRRGIRNIDFIWGDLEKAGGTKLKDASVDAAIISNTCFQLENKGAAITELKRVLKEGGKVLLVEWTGAHEGMGPAKEHVFAESAAEAAFTAEGFKRVKGFNAGPHHYAIVFTS
jgi:ubiquinone/menaquinone biosynthesis C-methylase UbiE